MIQSLLIKNVQSHKDSYLEFDRGVNIIIGPTDVGKTAILRTLRKLIWNRPLGEAMRSDWGGDMLIEVKLDSNKVQRLITKDFNGYVLENTTKFEAIKTEVPTEIIKVLNLTEINLQRQLDNPFLLSQTPGEIASHFNKVARLDKIDTGLQRVNSWINDLTSTIGKEAVKDRPATGLIKQLRDNEKELLKYDYLEKFEIEVEVLEQVENQLKSKNNSYNKFQTLLDGIYETNLEIEEGSKILQLESLVNAILDLINTYVEQEKNYLLLEGLIGDITWDDEELHKQQEVISIETPVNDLLKLYQDLKEKGNTSIKLKILVNNIISMGIQMTEAEKKYNILHKRFEDNFPSQCPLCGKPK